MPELLRRCPLPCVGTDFLAVHCGDICQGDHSEIFSAVVKVPKLGTFVALGNKRFHDELVVASSKEKALGVVLDGELVLMGELPHCFSPAVGCGIGERLWWSRKKMAACACFQL